MITMLYSIPSFPGCTPLAHGVIYGRPDDLSTSNGNVQMTTLSRIRQKVIDKEYYLSAHAEEEMAAWFMLCVDLKKWVALFSLPCIWYEVNNDL